MQSRGFLFCMRGPGSPRDLLLAIARAVEVRSQGGRMFSQGLLDAPVRAHRARKAANIPTVEHIDQAMDGPH